LTCPPKTNPDGNDWVDYIRKKSNEANHEIVIMDKEIAEDLISFIEMLLRFIFEFKHRLSPGKKTNPRTFIRIIQYLLNKYVLTKFRRRMFTYG